MRIEVATPGARPHEQAPQSPITPFANGDTAPMPRERSVRTFTYRKRLTRERIYEKEEVPTMSTLTIRTSTTNGETSEAFVVEAMRARDAFAGQLVLTQSRCVDQLLDLLNLANEPAVRSLLSDFLGEIRNLSAVRGLRFEQMLDLSIAASHVETAYATLVIGSSDS